MRYLKVLFSAPVLAALLMLAVAFGRAHGQTKPSKQGVAGKWIATWVSPAGGKPNKVKLTDSEMLVEGTYTADSGASCPVSGSNVVGRFAVTVTCPSFTIRMVGDVKTADKIEGTYTDEYGYGIVTGTFRMDRDTCVLPDGCKK